MTSRKTLDWLVGAGLLSGSLLAGPAAVLLAAEAPDSSQQMILDLIGEKDKEFRAAGLDQIRNDAKGDAATKLFAAQLPKLSPEARAELLSALADRGDAAARPAVLEFAGPGQDEQVRVAAIMALGKLGDADDVPLLVKSLTAKSESEQAAARASLAQLRGDQISKLLAADAKSADPNLKAALIGVLATRRATSETPAFLIASVDDNAQVRSAAMAALGQIGEPDLIAAMLPGVLKAARGGERDNAEKNVALVRARIPNENERGEALIKALDGVKPDERDQLLPLVGRVGGKKLIHFVVEIASSPETTRRELGIDALSKWPDASVADALLAIAKNAKDPAERLQAFSGYVKIAAARDKRSDRQRLERMKQAMKEAKTPEEEMLVINRSRTAYDVDTLRFVLPYVDDPKFAKVACETIVELAHHREVREPNKAEFDKALDKVIATSKDPVVVDRAERYKKGETWSKAMK